MSNERDTNAVTRISPGESSSVDHLALGQEVLSMLHKPTEKDRHLFLNKKLNVSPPQTKDTRILEFFTFRSRTKRIAFPQKTSQRKAKDGSIQRSFSPTLQGKAQIQNSFSARDPNSGS